jgi:hypothetical protein
MKNILSNKMLLPLDLLMILVLIMLSLAGCTSKTVYVPVPEPAAAPIQPQPTTYSPQPTSAPVVVQSTSAAHTWNWVPSPGNIVNGGQYAYFPAGGVYVQSGRILRLEWSADGNMETFILTENQYNNFKNQLSVATNWMAKGSGSSGTIEASVQNSDRYYGIVRNTFSLGSPVKLYGASLIEQ